MRIDMRIADRSAAVRGAVSRRVRTQEVRTNEAMLGLVEATLSILASQGLNGFTLAAVAKEAGYSAGLTVYHFGSKAALVHAAMDHAFAYGLQVAQIGKRTGQTPLDDLLGIVDGYYRATKARPLLVRGVYVLLTEGLHSGDQSIVDRITAFANDCRAYVRNLIESGVARSEIRDDITPDHLTTMFTGLLLGIEHAAPTISPDPHADELWRAAREMVAATFCGDRTAPRAPSGKNS